jgi:glutamate synthase (NADPH/NADH)
VVIAQSRDDRTPRHWSYCFSCLQITMEELRAASSVVVPESPAPVTNGELKDELTEHDLTRIWGGDRRLSLFGYTIETINMLLLPMIRTK